MSPIFLFAHEPGPPLIDRFEVALDAPWQLDGIVVLEQHLKLAAALSAKVLAP